MKRIGMFLIIFCMNIFNVFSNEEDANMLKIGFVRPLSYIINETEQLEYIKYFKIKLMENEFYELEINYSHDNISEYWTFRIKNIINNENKITGQLFDVSLEGTDGIVYLDEDSTGKIEIKNNVIEIEISHGIYNKIVKTKIIWENNME